MQVIEVVPLKKGISIESLSYYSAVDYPPGTLVTIPIRKKAITGMVLSSAPVSAAKTALRSATFSLRKLPPQETVQKLPDSLIATAQAITSTVPAKLGSILHSLLPPDVRNGTRAYPQLPEHLPGEPVPPAILIAHSEDRFITYRSHIREDFAHRGSVLFVVPTGAAVEEARRLLSNGIEKRVVTFASTHTKKQLDEAYRDFEDLSHSKLIITTPNFAFLCRHDITSIIIESAGSQHFVSRARPYLDARQSLKHFAKIIGASCTLGDTIVPTEDEVKRRDERYTTYGEAAQRLQLGGSLVTIEHPKESLEFSIFSTELIESMERTLANRGNVFLYASRRGLAPIVLCKDCGFIFRCPESGAPYSLLRSGVGEDERRWFYCGTSGVRTPAADICPDCGSWRLMEQGIGIQQVYDALQKQFREVPTILMDNTTANTHSKAKKLIGEFYTEKRAILVGSNLVLPYLNKSVDTTAIISYEAMRAVPTWRADETVFSTLLRLRELTNKDLLIQTRTPNDELLTLASRGLVEKYYDGEIAVRQALGYPPFQTFILLTFTGNKQQTAETETLITKLLPAREITFYSGPLSNETKTIRYGLLRIASEQYPNSELREQLNALPPYIKLEIDPAKII